MATSNINALETKPPSLKTMSTLAALLHKMPSRRIQIKNSQNVPNTFILYTELKQHQSNGLVNYASISSSDKPT